MRIVFGFVWACIVAGVVTVLFVDTPLDIAELAGIPMLEKIKELAVLALRVATHSAIFSIPFALLVALVAEWAHIRNWLYYAAAGMVIAALGFLLQYSSEVGGQPTIVNSYATLAYLTTGFLGGFAYWLFSGRRAGGVQADPEFVYEPAGRSPLFKRSEPDKSREATTEIRAKKTPTAPSKTPPPAPAAATKKASTPSPQSSTKPSDSDRSSASEDRGTSVPITNRPTSSGSTPTKS